MKHQGIASKSTESYNCRVITQENLISIYLSRGRPSFSSPSWTQRAERRRTAERSRFQAVLEGAPHSVPYLAEQVFFYIRRLETKQIDLFQEPLHKTRNKQGQQVSSGTFRYVASQRKCSLPFCICRPKVIRIRRRMSWSRTKTVWVWTDLYTFLLTVWDMV